MLQPTHHGNAFARARMVRVSDQNFKRLFLGSISRSRTAPRRSGRCRPASGAWRRLNSPSSSASDSPGPWRPDVQPPARTRNSRQSPRSCQRLVCPSPSNWLNRSPELTMRPAAQPSSAPSSQKNFRLQAEMRAACSRSALAVSPPQAIPMRSSHAEIDPPSSTSRLLVRTACVWRNKALVQMESRPTQAFDRVRFTVPPAPHPRRRAYVYL